MPALVVRSPGDVMLQDRARPVGVGLAEVLVRPSAIGVCGTDLDIVDGRVDPAFVQYPIVLGHEWSGVVSALGAAAAAVGDVAVGDLVVVEGIVPCGHCAACRHGDTNLCATYDEYGFTRDGAARDDVLAPAELVHVLPAATNAEAAALVEPMAVVHRALTRLNVQPGERALVIGDGTVGLLAAHLLQLWSPSEVVVQGRRHGQAGLVAAAGADRFLTRDGDGGFDVVVEAAGAVAATVSAIAAVRRGGRVGLLGFPGPGVTAPLVVDDVVNNDVTISGSFSYTSSSWRSVVGLLASGRIDPTFVITHRFALEQWADALELLRTGPPDDAARGKVLLLPSG